MGCRLVEEVAPKPGDHVVIKCRDSAFHDTEIKVWLSSLGIDILIFSGIDTTICVETSLCDAFNLSYDVVLIANATISSNKRYYGATIDNIKDYYGLVTDLGEFSQYLPQHQISTISKYR